jgi:hypothetical protein
MKGIFFAHKRFLIVHGVEDSMCAAPLISSSNGSGIRDSNGTTDADVTVAAAGWNSIPGNPIIKAKLRVLRYTKEIELNEARREKDLKFLSRNRVDLSFVTDLVREEA